MAAQKTRYSWLAHQPMQLKILIAIGTLVLLFVTCSIVTLQSLARQDVSAHWSKHTYEVRAKIDDVFEHLQASQIAVRSYLLDPHNGELDNHKKANADLAKDLADLRQLTSDNPVQQVRIDRVEAMVAEWQGQALHNGIEPMQAIRATDPAQAAMEQVHVQSEYLKHLTIGDRKSVV